MAEAGNPEERCRMEDVRADDVSRSEGKREEHREREERAASDRGQADDEAADGSDCDGDGSIAPGECTEPRATRTRAGECLQQKADCSDDQHSSEHLALDRVDAVAIAVGQESGSPDAEEGHRRAPEQHPGSESGFHRSEPPVANRPERLEDGTVQDVRSDREGRIEVEEEDEDGRHEGASAHSRHSDENPDEKTCECESWIVHLRVTRSRGCFGRMGGESAELGSGGV